LSAIIFADAADADYFIYALLFLIFCHYVISFHAYLFYYFAMIS